MAAAAEKRLKLRFDEWATGAFGAAWMQQIQAVADTSS